MQRVIGFYYFVFFAAMAATSPFLSLYLSEKGLDSTRIGLLLSIGAIAGIVAQPLLGIINDRARDPRRILLFSAILSPIAFAGYALIHGFWLLITVAVVVALSQSAAPIMDAIAVKQGAKSNFTYGQVRLWGALGYALATMVAGYVYDVWSIYVAFVAYGVFSVILVLVIRALPNTEPIARTQENMLHGIWNVARHKKLMAFIIICFILSIAITINASFLTLYYQDLHYPMGWVGLNFSVAAIVEVPFFYISGKLIKRFGLIPIIVIASGLFTLKYALMACAPGAFVVISIQVLDGIAYSLFWSASVQLVADLAPTGRAATAQTLYGAIANGMSSIAGTTLGGWLLNQFGPLSMYTWMAVLSAVAMVCYILFARIGLRQHGGDGPPVPQSE